MTLAENAVRQRLMPFLTHKSRLRELTRQRSNCTSAVAFVFMAATAFEHEAVVISEGVWGKEN